MRRTWGPMVGAVPSAVLRPGIASFVLAGDTSPGLPALARASSMSKPSLSTALASHALEAKRRECTIGETPELSTRQALGQLPRVRLVGGLSLRLGSFHERSLRLCRARFTPALS